MSNMVQVSKAEAEEMIQAFAFETTNPRLGVSVGNRCPNRRFNNMPFLRFEQRIEGLSELRVVVTQEEAKVDVFFVSPQQQVAPLLLDPV